MCATFNSSTCRMDRQGMQMQSVIYYAQHRGKHRQFVSVGVFQRRGVLFGTIPLPWGTPRKIPIVCDCW